MEWPRRHGNAFGAILLARREPLRAGGSYNMLTDVVILAAGKGTRMRSAIPKVLQPVGGRPLIGHVLKAVSGLAGVRQVHAVLGFGAEQVKTSLGGYPAIQWWNQPEQKGTGDALRAALPGLEGADRILVLYGDVPLLRCETLRAFLDAVPAAHALGICTASIANPQGYGRILRNAAGEITGIREERDCTAEEASILEVNLGITLFPSQYLPGWLNKLKPHNAQGEYYLTDVVAMAAAQGFTVMPHGIADPDEALGVNDARQLASLERIFQRRAVEGYLDQGLRIADPARIDIRGELAFGPDCWLDPNVIIEGRVQLGAGVRIGAGAILRDSEIGDGAEILPYSHIDGARIGGGARVGPFARIRPGSEIGAAGHVGNFVEMKNVCLGAGSKANHLSYLGDARVGAGVNIGAGVITCNYDGAAKHQTVIGDGAFIGSDTQLVAPVQVGQNATVGAGSTITRDVPEGGLTLSRVPQKTVPGWKRPGKPDTGS